MILKVNQRNRDIYISYTCIVNIHRGMFTPPEICQMAPHISQ